MLQMLNKPCSFYVVNSRSNFFKAITTGLFVILFLWLFDNRENESLLLFVDNGIIVFISQFIALIVLRKLFFDSDVRYWQYILWLAFSIFFGFTLMYLYVVPVYYNNSYSFGDYIHYLRENQVFLFPITIFILAADYIAVLKQRLSKRSSPPSLEEIKRKNIPGVNQVIGKPTFTIFDKKGAIIFESAQSQVFYIKSADNYAEVCYKDAEQVKKQLIRCSLNSIENTVENIFLVRVHRSYLCNLENAIAVSGAIQNCLLHFNVDKMVVPVARNRARDISKKVNNVSQSPH